MTPVPASMSTSADGDGEIILTAELPEPKIDLSANADHSSLLDLVRMAL
jgi:hypothetical protein